MNALFGFAYTAFASDRKQKASEGRFVRGETMDIVVTILASLVLVGLVFFVIPAIVVFVVLFRGKRFPDLDKQDLKGTQYEPYQEMLKEDIGYFRKQEMAEVSVKSFDGRVLRGKYLDGGYDKTAILVHGYRSSPLNNFAVLGRFLFEEKGFNLLFVDQRATGESDGMFVGMGLLEKFDVRAWERYVSKMPEVKEILIAGVSMGATSIAFTADHLNPKKVSGVILDCGFECPRDQLLHMSEQYKPLPGKLILPIVEFMVRLILRIDLNENTTKHLNRMTVPALFLHGEQDDTVPFYEGQNAYRECGSNKMRYFVEDAGHATAFYAHLEEGKRAVSQFLENCFGRVHYDEEDL